MLNPPFCRQQPGIARGGKEPSGARATVLAAMRSEEMAVEATTVAISLRDLSCLNVFFGELSGQNWDSDSLHCS